jgi:ATP-binding cassette subfamily F protein 3
VLWLQNYLIKKFKGTLVVVSHDRHFLNEVVTDVVHFHRGKLTTYRGDISNFTAVLEENKNRQIRLFEQQEAQRAHLQKCKFIIALLFAIIVNIDEFAQFIIFLYRH